MVNHPSDDFAITPTHDGSESLALDLVITELRAARAKFGPQRSAHEGYAVLLEEVDELWDEIKKNDKLRSKGKMLAEAKQVAAMAIRFMIDVCGSELPRVPVTLFTERRRVGCIRMIDRTLSGIIVRKAGKTVYRGVEQRVSCQQILGEDERKTTRRSGARETIYSTRAGISVFEMCGQAPRRHFGRLLYEGPERRKPGGGRRKS